MKKVWKYLVMLCFMLALAWLFAMAVGGTTGIIVGGAFIGVCLVVLLFGGIENRDVKSPFLLDLIMILINFSLFKYIEFWPFTVFIGLGGVIDIINRTVHKDYDTRSVKAFLKTEFRFPPYLDLILILLFAADMVKDADYANWVGWIVMLLLLADYVRQKLIKK